MEGEGGGVLLGAGEAGEGKMKGGGSLGVRALGCRGVAL